MCGHYSNTYVLTWPKFSGYYRQYLNLNFTSISDSLVLISKNSWSWHTRVQEKDGHKMQPYWCHISWEFQVLLFKNTYTPMSQDNLLIQGICLLQEKRPKKKIPKTPNLTSVTNTTKYWLNKLWANDSIRHFLWIKNF